jgi:hypothetical protein
MAPELLHKLESELHRQEAESYLVCPVNIVAPREDRGEVAPALSAHKVVVIVVLRPSVEGYEPSGAPREVVSAHGPSFQDSTLRQLGRSR